MELIELFFDFSRFYLWKQAKNLIVVPIWISIFVTRAEFDFHLVKKKVLNCFEGF